MKLNKLFYLFGISSLTLLCQCQKEPVVKSEDCQTVEIVNGYGQSLFSGSFPIWDYPYFNPNNPDEILYRFADGSSN